MILRNNNVYAGNSVGNFYVFVLGQYVGFGNIGSLQRYNNHSPPSDSYDPYMRFLQCLFFMRNSNASSDSINKSRILVHPNFIVS